MSFLLPCNNQQYLLENSLFFMLLGGGGEPEKGQNHCFNKLVDVVYNQ
jgi:hypothetical protein